MTISPARLAANQRNAAQSTGPKTEAGKLRSRANAVKHGLRANVVPVGDPATLHAREVGVAATIRPQNEFQAWLCGRIAQTTMRLDHLQAVEREVRADAADRAEACWDDDQRLEACRIAARLARDPDRTVGLLRRSLAGCDWLIERWSHLAETAARQAWTEDQRMLAHHLLGTPPEFYANPLPPELSETQLAQSQVDALCQHRASVVETDLIAQHLAMADLNDLGNRDLGRLRRYERMLLTDFHRAFAMAQHESPSAGTNPRCLPSIPAQFLDPPPPPAAPNEPKPSEIVAPKEPKTSEIVAPKEPKLDQPRAPNKPNPTSSGPYSARVLNSLSPDLMVMLNEGIPDPDTLDPVWCREFVAANLASGRFGSLTDPAPPRSRRRKVQRE